MKKACTMTNYMQDTQVELVMQGHVAAGLTSNKEPALLGFEVTK